MSRQNIYNNFYNAETYSNVNLNNKLLLEDYLLELKQNKKSSQTISQYQNDIRICFLYIYNHLDNKSILELNKKDFRNYSLYLIGDCKLSNARHNRMLSSIHSLLNFAENEDDYDYDNNISKKVKGLPKELVREIFFLTDGQVLKLKDILIEKKEYQKASLLMLAYDSAGRKAELCQVNKQSFYDPNRNNTNKVIGKRRKIFSLVYFSGTKECVLLWLKQRGEDNIDSLWVVGSEENKKPATSENLYEWFMHIRNILSNMEGKEIDINIHSMRHTCLENLSLGTHYICRELGMSGGFPIEKLKLLANHSDISTTSSYLKDNSADELSEMFNIKIQ